MERINREFPDVGSDDDDDESDIDDDEEESDVYGGESSNNESDDESQNDSKRTKTSVVSNFAFDSTKQAGTSEPFTFGPDAAKSDMDSSELKTLDAKFDDVQTDAMVLKYCHILLSKSWNSYARYRRLSMKHVTSEKNTFTVY